MRWLLVLLLVMGCTPLTMPTLPLGQVSEAFREGNMTAGERMGGMFIIPLTYASGSAYPGWNLIALPLGFAFEKATADVPYEIYHLTENFYQGGKETTLVQGKAYWVKVKEPGTLRFTGKSSLQEGLAKQELHDGWNQIGIGLNPIQLRYVSLEHNKKKYSLKQAYQNNLLHPVFYYWDSRKGDWLFLNAEREEAEEKFLYPGVGYFVLMKKPVTMWYAYGETP